MTDFCILRREVLNEMELSCIQLLNFLLKTSDTYLQNVQKKYLFGIITDFKRDYLKIFETKCFVGSDFLYTYINICSVNVYFYFFSGKRMGHARYQKIKKRFEPRYLALDLIYLIWIVGVGFPLVFKRDLGLGESTIFKGSVKFEFLASSHFLKIFYNSLVVSINNCTGFSLNCIEKSLDIGLNRMI